MPSISFLESHAESVQVLVHHVKEGEGVDNSFVLTLLVELDVVSGKGVADTKIGSSDSSICNML